MKAIQQSANRYERIAGVFVLLAIVITLLATAGVVYEKGWLARKTSFHTYLKTASGIHQGTQVHIFGIKAGWVDDVELISAGKVKVTIDILNKYQPYVTADSEVQVVRPFVVGQKVLELAVGKSETVLQEGDFIPHRSGIDVVDLLSGRLLGPLMTTLTSIADDLKLFTQAFAEKDLQAPLTRLVKEIEPLISNMNRMSREVAKTAGTLNNQDILLHNMQGVLKVTEDLNKMMPSLVENAPVLAEKLPVLINNMTELSTEINRLSPVMTEVAPQVPDVLQRTTKAIDEAVLTMKGLQKSFLLRGKMEDVRKELADERAR